MLNDTGEFKGPLDRSKISRCCVCCASMLVTNHVIMNDSRTRLLMEHCLPNTLGKLSCSRCEVPDTGKIEC